MWKLMMSCSLLLLLNGCVTKAGLEEILQKIDHNNMVILKRVETLEKKDGTETKNVPTPQAK